MLSINNVLNRRSFLVGATLIFAPIYFTPASVLLKNAKDMSYDMTLMVLFRARALVTEQKHYFHIIKWLNCIN